MLKTITFLLLSLVAITSQCFAGDVTFGEAKTAVSGADAQQLEVKDLDGDSKPDLIWRDSSGNLKYSLQSSEVPAENIVVPMELTSWIQRPDGSQSTWEITTEGLKVSLGSYRTNIRFAPKMTSDLSNAEMFMKWKAFGNGNYAFFVPVISHIVNDSIADDILGVGGTTHHSFGGSVLISENIFHYTRIKINPDKTYEAFTSTGDYDSKGGTVVITKSDIFSDSDWIKISNASFGALLGDNYDAAAYMIVSEVIIKK
ncbi:hypothetical protein WDW89_17295 [Deltaproteobacteria bacterium TL4]